MAVEGEHDVTAPYSARYGRRRGQQAADEECSVPTLLSEYPGSSDPAGSVRPGVTQNDDTAGVIEGSDEAVYETLAERRSGSGRPFGVRRAGRGKLSQLVLA